MCDRSKVEVLARELAAQYYCGANPSLINGKYVKRTGPPVHELVEGNWDIWSKHAANLIHTLDSHEHKKT